MKVKEPIKSTTNAPPAQDGKQRTAVRRKHVSSENDAKSNFKFLCGEVTFTDEPWKYRAYAVTLLVLGSITIIWLVKGWAIITAIYKKVSTLKIKALLGKEKFY